jgi:predicted DCC family thiol-disulfide oxidoreductase YuxK
MSFVHSVRRTVDRHLLFCFLMRRFYLIYDDQCPLCRAGLEQVRQLDTLGLVTPVPLSNPTLPPSLELPPFDQLRQALHLIDSDGTRYAGAEAVARIATLFPRSRFLGRILLWPVVRPLARLIYGRVARHRLLLARLTCRADQT